MIDNGISPELRRFAEALVANVPADVAMLLACLKCENLDELHEFGHRVLDTCFSGRLKTLTNANATRDDYAALLRGIVTMIQGELGPDPAAQRAADARLVEALKSAAMYVGDEYAEYRRHHKLGDGEPSRTHLRGLIDAALAAHAGGAANV